MKNPMKQLSFAILLLAIVTTLLTACEEKEPATLIEQPPTVPGQTRSFALGFTDFPYAATSEAFHEGYEIIRNDADLAVMHFDDGVPWQDAFDRQDYSVDISDELRSKTALIPRGHLVYLAITPLSFERSDIADHKGGEDTPWRAKLDDPDVITAYTNHAKKMIKMFDPNYFAYAIEANMFHRSSPERWDEFVTLAASVYVDIKDTYPDLPVFITIQADFFHQDPEAQSEALIQILPYTDFIAISTYPYIYGDAPDSLTHDHFTAISDLAPEKPFAIAETAWPAEDISDPYPVIIEGSESAQLAYVERLIEEATDKNAVFITWFFTRDFDEFWEAQLKDNPIAPTIRLWKDTGLYDGDGNPRPALGLWKDALDIKRQR